MTTSSILVQSVSCYELFISDYDYQQLLHVILYQSTNERGRVVRLLKR